MASTSGDIAPSTRRILVDDASAQIQYSGNWTVNSQGIQDKIGDFGPTFRQTLHGTPQPFGNLSFTFEGSSVAVYGIVSMIGPISFEVEPIWKCFVDGKSIRTPTTIYTNQNRQKLCEFDKLDSSEAHTLAISTTNNEQLFWVDYIEYTPSSTANITGAFVSIQYDDDLLVYDETWQLSGSGAKSTSTVGATVNTSFTGTGVLWYGAIPSEASRTPSTGAYSIDGQPPNTFAIRRIPSSENSTSPPSLFNQIFFETPVLPFGKHNITVTYTGSGIPLSLDRLVIQNFSIQNATNDTTNPSPSQPVSASSKAPSTSKIVGAVLGGGTSGETGLLVNPFLHGFHPRTKVVGRREPPQANPSRAMFIHSGILRGGGQARRLL
ncbi:hypothetical protein H1R20_g8569, partial [Candolleomyces eurysporus]